MHTLLSGFHLLSFEHNRRAGNHWWALFHGAAALVDAYGVWVHYKALVEGDDDNPAAS